MNVCACVCVSCVSVCMWVVWVVCVCEFCVCVCVRVVCEWMCVCVSCVCVWERERELCVSECVCVWVVWVCCVCELCECVCQLCVCVSFVCVCELCVWVCVSECVYVCVCVLASVIQHSKRIRRIMLPSVASLALPYVCTLSHKGHDFRKKFAKLKCVYWFSLELLSGKFLILRIQRDVIIFLRRSSHKAPVIRVIFYGREYRER